MKYWNRSGNTELDYAINDYPTNAIAFDKNGDGYKDLIITFRDKNTQGVNETLYFESVGYMDAGVPTFYPYDVYVWDIQPENGTAGILLADFDNDGILDFYAPNHEGQQLYHGTSSGFVKATTSLGLDPALGTINGAWGDIDGDSFLDLYVLDGSQENGLSNSQHFYHNIPDGTGGRMFADETTSHGIPQTQKAMSVLWADFDGDHDGDLVVMQGHASSVGEDPGEHNLYLKNVGGVFVNVTTTMFGSGFDLAWNRNGLGVVMDVDNDADLDIAYHQTNWVGYFANDGSGVLSPAWESNITSEEPRDLEILDYDLDGRIDLLLAQIVNFPHTHPYLYGNRAGAVDFTFVNETGSELNELGGQTDGILPSDMTFDGFTELYCGRYDYGDGPNDNYFFYKAAPAQNHVQANWIGFDIRCESGQDNSYGIGATVIVSAGDHVQAQLISGGGSGYASQPELTRLFGLGDYGGPVDVTIKWPCGDLQQYYGLEPNQYHDIQLAPKVDDSTVSFQLVYDVLNEVWLWKWQWETSWVGDQSLDAVTLSPAHHRPTLCVDETITYTPNTPGVIHSTSATTRGTYQHILIKPRDCEAICKFNYTVKSAIGTYTSTSTERSATISTCLQGS